ncbi:methyltransferase domain-containing protein [Mycolicibacterium flavescens]|uniref:SAM-dependent methyltransferase n=1 Tax=Mycolicibacterium flavescens TaxID=1776 RepID=A0A1E3RR41_MYCFV|nr:methyltransferase domain-containing protein [Mycolicibacterium flavescens]MCV7279681.1 methyltransferase domain-containing protein [Mycolicibacterium flavescens]ODQ92324.1 SAM-dependent methyltransferase [Mycolicibacterium flavescens]
MNPLRRKLMAATARQLGRPHGPFGLVVAKKLNRSNERAVAAAVDATGVGPGAVVTDVGFGGGVGLRLLLDRVGRGGVVHGVEVAETMLRRARRGFARDIAAGRLRLHDGSLTALPFDDGVLDAVVTVNTVYFIPDLDAACAELARVVRPGGRVVIGIGDPDVMRHAPFTAYGFTLRPVDEVRAALAGTGLTVEHRPIADHPIPRHVLVGR